MDTIKFKAYRKDLGILPVVNLQYTDSGTISSVTVIDKNGDHIVMDSDYQLIRFTGRRTVEGQEIFEHDILDSFDGDFRLFVYWDEWNGRFVLKNSIDFYDFDSLNLDAFLLVGNMFEDSHLIE